MEKEKQTKETKTSELTNSTEETNTTKKVHKKSATRIIARTGIIAALYIALSLAVFPVASGTIQFRISEGLTILPLFLPESIIGLFVGCIFSNLITGAGIIDIFMGSLITLVAGVLTRYIGRLLKNKFWQIGIGGLFPVLLNAFFLPLIWMWQSTMTETYWVSFGFLILGEAVSVYVVGTPIYFISNKYQDKLFR